MPTIQQYELPNLGLQPTETGITATAAAARRVTGAYSEAAQAKMEEGHVISGALTTAIETGRQYEVHQELNNGAPAWANTQFSIDKQWSDYHKAHPDDPAGGQKFLNDVVEPQLQKFRSGFITDEGQKFAEGRIDAYREHLFKKAAADSARGAGDAFPGKVQGTVNALGASLRLDPTPANVDAKIEELHKTLGVMGAPGQKISDKDMMKAEKELIGSAVHGYQKQNGGDTPSYLDDPKYSKYFDDKERQAFESAGRTYNNWDTKKAKQQQQAQDLAYKDDFDKRISDTEQSMRPQTVDQPHTVPPNLYSEILPTLAEHPYGGADKAKKIADLDKMAQAIQDHNSKPPPLAKTSHDTMASLNEQIRNGQITDQSQIWANLKNMTTADFNFTMRNFDELKTADGRRLTMTQKKFFEDMKTQITKSNYLQGTVDDNGDAQFYRFQWDVAAAVDNARQQNKDPYELFDPTPGNQAYLGSPDKLAKYQLSYQQSMENAQQKMTRGMNMQPATPTPAAPVAPAPAAPAPPAAPARPSVPMSLPAQPAPTPAIPDARARPGESPDDYFRRQQGGAAQP